ncbi:MAG: hypothetical protein AAFX59_00805 [Pseudomonadota bacterium]
MSFGVETALPILCLAALGWLVPWAIQRMMPDRLPALALSLVAATGVLSVIGAGLFAWLYVQQGLAPAALGTGAAVAHFFGLGLRGAIVWGPVLLLTGLSLGRGIEAGRGNGWAPRDGSSRVTRL